MLQKDLNKRVRKSVTMGSQSALCASTSLPGGSDERYLYGAQPMVAWSTQNLVICRDLDGFKKERVKINSDLLIGRVEMMK